MYPHKFVFSNKIKGDIIASNELSNSKVLCGVVFDNENIPIKDAIIKVEPCDRCEDAVYIVTDKDGEFIYGPLKSSCNINIKVWVENVYKKIFSKCF